MGTHSDPIPMRSSGPEGSSLARRSSESLQDAAAREPDFQSRSQLHSPKTYPGLRRLSAGLCVLFCFKQNNCKRPPANHVVVLLSIIHICSFSGQTF